MDNKLAMVFKVPVITEQELEELGNEIPKCDNEDDFCMSLVQAVFDHGFRTGVNQVLNNLEQQGVIAGHSDHKLN